MFEKKNKNRTFARFIGSATFSPVSRHRSLAPGAEPQHRQFLPANRQKPAWTPKVDMGMMAPAQASVAQLDRVLPSEGRGRGFESRRVHHILVSGCLRQSTKHPKKPALCGLCCIWLSVPVYPYNFPPCTPTCML